MQPINPQGTEKERIQTPRKLSNTLKDLREQAQERGKGVKRAGGTPISHTQHGSGLQHWAHIQTVNLPICWAQSCQTEPSSCLSPPSSSEEERLQVRACAGIAANPRSVL